MNASLREKLIDKSYALRELPNCQQKHFSFIIKRNKIISLGWNNGYRTHPKSKIYKCRFSTIHSELAAIKNYGGPISDLIDYKLINVRIRRDGTIGLSKPCDSCMMMLAVFEFREVWYTNNLGEFVEL